MPIFGFKNGQFSQKVGFVAIFERIFKGNLWRKNDFCPLFLANCPLLKLKMASNFCLIYWVFWVLWPKTHFFLLLIAKKKYIYL